METMSFEQKRRTEQLYHELGLDAVVNRVLKDFSSSLSGIDRVLDKIFGPYDIKGRAAAVARLTASSHIQHETKSTTKRWEN